VKEKEFTSKLVMLSTQISFASFSFKLAALLNFVRHYKNKILIKGERATKNASNISAKSKILLRNKNQ
jgi:hypothetical protein